LTRNNCQKLDMADDLAAYRDEFVVPEGIIYLDGNSLGLVPRRTAGRVADVISKQWAKDHITSWNKHGWFEQPLKLGNRIARLVGGGDDNMVVADTISINLFKLLTAALTLRPERKVILSDDGNFPSDLYVAQGLCSFLTTGHRLKLVAPEEVIDALDETVAVVTVTEVDYRSSRRHIMVDLIRKAHSVGALVIWDLSHSVGAIPVDLIGADSDFAVGCTYKYLNAGPGAQAFVFVHPRHRDAVPALVGWFGDARPFAFETRFEPAPGIARWQVGTQSVLGLAALGAALDIWDGVDMGALDRKRISLCDTFIRLTEQHCPTLRLAGLRDMAQRGSHVSFHCAQGYAVMQALIAHGVVGDFRAPDLIRFGFAPLYNTHVEVWDAVMVMKRVLNERLWDNPAFLKKKAVT
jgi:kynureninase